MPFWASVRDDVAQVIVRLIAERIVYLGKLFVQQIPGEDAVEMLVVIQPHGLGLAVQAEVEVILDTQVAEDVALSAGG